MTAPTSQKPLIYLAITIALGALGIAIYLSAQALTGSAVAGCGGGSGCAVVLASPWSKVGPVPVSLLACATYIAVLVGLGMRLKTQGQSKIADAILLISAPAIVIAAFWFTYIQLVELDLAVGELCPYCTADHLLGSVLSVLLLVIVLGRSAIKPEVPLIAGALCVGMVITIQTVAPYQPPVVSVENLFVDRDGEAWIGEQRYVSMFGGELQFFLDDEPYLGQPDAQQVVAIVFDYACPHCKEVHELLHDALGQDPGRFVLVTLPVSIHESVNPHTDDFSSRFEDSYERAALSLAVAALDREKWIAFDRWLFSPGDDEAFPRSAAQAREQAQALVGVDGLRQQMTGQSLAAHHAQVDRNIALLGLIPAESRYVPVTSTPGGSTHLTSGYADIQVLYDYLDAAASKAQPSR